MTLLDFIGISVCIVAVLAVGKKISRKNEVQ